MFGSRCWPAKPWAPQRLPRSEPRPTWGHLGTLGRKRVALSPQVWGVAGPQRSALRRRLWAVPMTGATCPPGALSAVPQPHGWAGSLKKLCTAWLGPNPFCPFLPGHRHISSATNRVVGAWTQPGAHRERSERPLPRFGPGGGSTAGPGAFLEGQASGLVSWGLRLPSQLETISGEPRS